MNLHALGLKKRGFGCENTKVCITKTGLEWIYYSIDRNGVLYNIPSV